MQSEDDYGQRRLLQLHHQHTIGTHQTRASPPPQQPLPSQVSSAVPPSADRYQQLSTDRYKSDKSDRYTAYGSQSGNDKYEKNRYYVPSDRYATLPVPERFASAPISHGYHKNSATSSNSDSSSSANCGSIYQELCNNTSGNTLPYQSEGKSSSKYTVKANENASKHTPAAYNTVKYHHRHSFGEDAAYSRNLDDENEGITSFSHQTVNTTYVPPPSPAPRDDRFIPPPPLSPQAADNFKSSTDSPSPDGYHPNNSFPSPSPNSERFPPVEQFVPPPPLSPTEEAFCRTFGSPKHAEARYHTPAERYLVERYASDLQRYEEQRYVAASERYIATGTQTTDRYHRYTPSSQALDRYALGNNSERYTSSADRFSTTSDRYPSDRYATLPNPNLQERYGNNSVLGGSISNGAGSGGSTSSVPPSAHTPVERYVPQPTSIPNDAYGSYGATIHYAERYLTSAGVAMPPGDRYLATNSGDPYMRRDLGFHHHYRLPAPYHHHHNHHHQYHNGSHFHRQRYVHSPGPRRCCPSPNHYTAEPQFGASPGSSSSGDSSVIQSPSMRKSSTPPAKLVLCNKHVCAPSANATPEYIGSSGGRLITSSTPSPSLVVQQSLIVAPQTTACLLAKCATTGGSTETQVQCDLTSNGAAQNVCCAVAAAAAVRRGAQQITMAPVTAQATGANHMNTYPWRATGHHPNSSPNGAQSSTSAQTFTSSNNRSQTDLSAVVTNQNETSTSSATLTTSSSGTPANSSSPSSGSPPLNASPHVQHSTYKPTLSQTHATPQIQRAVSLPTGSIPVNVEPQSSPVSGRSSRIRPSARRPEYTQSERIPNTRERPRFARSTSRKEAIKNFIKKETATFFGVDEETESEQRIRWLDRRKRLASRKYGELKDEYAAPTGRTTRPRTYSGYTASGAVPREPREDRPDVLPVDAPDTTDSVVERVDRPVRRKDSVARLTWNGLSYVVTTLTRHRPRPRSQQRPSSRSFPPEEAQLANDLPGDYGLVDEVFFEPPSSPTSLSQPVATGSGDVPDAGVMQPSAALTDATNDTRYSPSPTVVRPHRHSSSGTQGAWRRVAPEQTTHAPPAGQRQPGCQRVCTNVLDGALDNSDRRQYGMGWVGRMFGRSMRRSVAREEHVQAQLDDLEDYRPFFTWWVTTVQVLVLIISLICYGLGPIGLDLAQRSGQVLVTSLSLQQVDYQEPANFWLGPRAADLIHLGAKFAPCMRRDAKIIKEIEKVREKERETACCIRNDDSGCVQSSQADCSKIISTWKKWSARDAGPGGRLSGSVCGLDPKYCDAPASVAPYEWPDDITKWPICRKTNDGLVEQARGGGGRGLVGRPRDKAAEHMVCEVIGHPCCIGIHGECQITTREYCDFVRGYFHEEASLCSQVSCMDDVCGMVPFYFPESPDQFYRLWTSLFLHAGALQLCITVLVQYTLMRDLEKLAGPLRIAVIYLGSGVAGNLASAIFVPYRAEVGPAGAQFGLLACLVVEVLNMWPMLQRPDRALIKLLSITAVLFLIGLLPWIDNYAHLFGFVFGFLLSYALLPFVSFGPYDRERKIALIWACLVSAVVLFACLVALFYVIPVYDCKACTYFNCLPLTRNFCASQNINFKREDQAV